jgi:hypothetical protein
MKVMSSGKKEKRLTIFFFFNMEDCEAKAPQHFIESLRETKVQSIYVQQKTYIQTEKGRPTYLQPS